MPKISSIVTMTPEWAERLLATNENNRSISKNAVNAMARDMEAGHFMLNGESIKLTEDGTLADGQHRLSACVLAGVSFETWLTEGLTRADLLTLDRGRPRGAGDNLMIAYGVKAGRQVAATIRNMVIFAKQDLAANPTASEIKEILDAHPLVVESATSVDNVTPARPSLIAAIHYIGTHFHHLPTEADQFVHVFRTGLPEYEGDAAHALRELMLKEKAKGLRGTNLRHYSLMANAWEKFSQRVPVRTARARDDFRLHGWNEAALTQPIVDPPPPEEEEPPKGLLGRILGQ